MAQKNSRGFTNFTNISVLLLILILIVLFFLLITTYKKQQEKSLWETELYAQRKLLDLSKMQKKFKASRKKDLDRDGIGEYGYIRDFIKSPFEVFPEIKLKKEGYIVRWGYNYSIYLSGGKDKLLCQPTAKTHSQEEIDLQEKYWVCYAWPSRNLSNFFLEPRNTYVINQKGEIYRCRSNKYSGKTAPKGNAVFQKWHSIEAPFASSSLKKGENANDGEKWIRCLNN